ncbi:acyl-CoA dehydrogenase family protein [Myxococcus sp. K15C18031901]|uniref:acyl-CoA dehydrogenase family protein n=1 Tax=Myxococcus dinghuensis TaxID=2906761 RepID=UPI0020A82D54|nr:acyl-CoA dehydrogenase family protein [Myxococcus dinghuensis]MCP3097324.1 acyl-CoA dehydrogenase family protein [Myxococcus dinghuensis]
MEGEVLPAETPEFQAARTFGQSLGAPRPGADAQAWFRESWRKAAGFGLLELLIPEGALDVETALCVLEGVGMGCKGGGFPLGLGAHCFAFCSAVLRFGDEAQRRLLPSLRDGTAIGALAATEPGSGSDVMSLRTRYRAEGEGFLLRGDKCFITNAREADWFLVLATRDPRLHYRGISAFLVPRDTPGVHVGLDEPRLGMHGCSVGSVGLDEVRVPRSAMLGPPGRGAAVFQHALLWERGLLAGFHLGVMRRQFLAALDYAKTRRQFGRPIGANQQVGARLVDMLTRYRTSALLVRETAARLATGALTAGEASLTKLYVSEAALASGTDAFRIHGGMGFMEGSDVGVELRDALGGILYSGTSEIQKVIIASELGLAC